MTETAVILALVVILVMIAVTIFGNRLGALWAMLSSTLPGGSG
jgi:Flp pilus assembly pilin Flp